MSGLSPGVYRYHTLARNTLGATVQSAVWRANLLPYDPNESVPLAHFGLAVDLRLLPGGDWHWAKAEPQRLRVGLLAESRLLLGFETPLLDILPHGGPLTVSLDVEDGDETVRAWTETARGPRVVDHVVSGFVPGESVTAEVDGAAFAVLTADEEGRVTFTIEGTSSGTRAFRLR